MILSTVNGVLQPVVLSVADQQIQTSQSTIVEEEKVKLEETPLSSTSSSSSVYSMLTTVFLVSFALWLKH